MAQPIMNALDAIAGSQASAYITLADGNRYCFMQLYSFESKMDISVAEVPILGQRLYHPVRREPLLLHAAVFF